MRQAQAAPKALVRTKRRNRERRKTESERQPAKPKARLRTQIITQAPGAPGKPKAPAKGPPGAKNTPSAKGKGKGGPKQGDGKVPSKSPSSGKNAPKGPPPAKTPAGAKAPCLFWPKGTCNRGSNCPFAHDSSLAPKATSKTPGTVSTTAAAATVAAVLPSASAHAVEPKAFGTGQSLFARSGLRGFFRCFAGWFSVLSSAVPAVLPSERSTALPGLQSGPFHVDWIADSGADRNLTSIKALTQQGVPSDVIKHVTQSQPVTFSTGNGFYTSSEVLNSEGSSFGNSSSYVMHDCPVVRSLGELVNEGQRPFVLPHLHAITHVCPSSQPTSR